ncbi:MAG: hypothetical protein LUG93_10905 [Lachnospiraceae bacterium]|nr:hypothetical protein [Lachnospiraceae bacterium]
MKKESFRQRLPFFYSLPHQNYLIHQKLADADRDEFVFIIARLFPLSHINEFFTEKIQA